MVGTRQTAVRSLCAIALAMGVAAGVSACSPGLFLPNADPLKTPNYRPINTACEIQSRSATLDAPTLRSLVHCFNSFGALQPIEKMVSKLSDQDLQPVVDSFSKYILNQPKTLYAIDQSFQNLDAQGKQGDVFQSLGRVLDNDEFVVSLLVLLKEAYYQRSSGPLSWFSPPVVDPNVPAALKYLSKKMNAANAGNALEVALTLATASPFKSVQKKFRSDSSAGRNLHGLTDAVMSYVQDSSPHRVDVGQQVLNALVREDLFRALDEAIGGSTPGSLQQGMDRFASILREAFSGNGETFDGIASLFHGLHVPIHCLKDTQLVPDGTMFFFREVTRQNTSDVSDYIRITNPLTEIAVNPFCDEPPVLAQYYPYAVQLALSNAVEPTADLMKALYRPETSDPITHANHHLLAELMVDSLAENSIKNLTPVFAELNDRDVWDDLLLIATLPREEDRDSIANALRYISDSMDGTRGASVYQVFLNAAQRVEPADFYRFVASLEKFTDQDQPIFEPALLNFRRFYYVNSAHPFPELLREFLEDAPSPLNEKFFATLFKTVDMSEFQDSVKLLSTMATDGRFKQIVDAVLAIYRPVSQTGQIPISPTQAPGFETLARHKWDETDLRPYALVQGGADPNDPCSHLDLGFGVDQFNVADYDEKLDFTVHCLARKPQDKPIIDAIQYLRSEKSEESGWDYFRLPIELVKKWDPSHSELQYLSNAWLRNFDSGYFLNLLDTVPFLVSRAIAPQASGPTFDAGPVLRPLLDLAKPFVDGDSRPRLQKVEKFAAAELRRDDFPKTLESGHELFQKAPEPAYAPFVSTFDRERLKRWVMNKECERPDSRDPELRATQVIDDFDNALDNWTLQGGVPRRTYALDDFRTLLHPTLQKLAHPELNAPDEPLVDAFIRVIRHFSRDPSQPQTPEQQYTPDEFLQWVKDRSSDYKLITYYYKDEHGRFEDNPRVRLVNTLDRMELVLVDADFQVDLLGLQIVGNSSLQYTAELAEAWGDEPRQLWPDRIKALYPPGAPIKKIKDVIDDMEKSLSTFEDLAGFPDHPKCKQTFDPNDPPEVQAAETTWPGNHSGLHLPEIGFLRDVERSLYNLNQVLEVLNENRPLDQDEPRSRHLNPDHAGGMRVLRDLMYELYFSTPGQYRSYKLKRSEEWRNNLKVSDDLSRLGLFRGLGQAMRRFKGDEKQLYDAFRTFFSASNLPQTRDALVALFQTDPDQKVFWTALSKVFNVFGTAEQPQGTEAQKQEWVREAARMKQTGLYSLAVAGPDKLTGPLLGAVAIAAKEFPDFLTQHSDEIESLLRSPRASYLTRALYEESDPEKQELIARVVRTALSDPDMVRSLLGLLEAVDQDPQAQSAWTLFSERKDALFALPEFQPYRQYFDRFSDDLIYFFGDQSSESEAVLAADHARRFTADMLENGDIDQFLLLAKKNPNKFYQVFQTLSVYIENGQLKEFFNLVRRSLSDPS